MARTYRSLIVVLLMVVTGVFTATAALGGNHDGGDEPGCDPSGNQPQKCETEAPTEEPTEPATEEPTEPATEEPTEPATEGPTEDPNQEPNEEPTDDTQGPGGVDDDEDDTDDDGDGGTIVKDKEVTRGDNAPDVVGDIKGQRRLERNNAAATGDFDALANTGPRENALLVVSALSFLLAGAMLLRLGRNRTEWLTAE